MTQKRMNCMQTLRLCAIGALLIGTVTAADFHLSPAGSGTRDGSSAQNAAPGSSGSSLFNDKLQPGDRLLLGPGEYSGISFNLAKGGTKEKPKTLAGAPGTVFSSKWSIEKPDKGATAITLAPGASHIAVQNIGIRNYCFAVRANPSKDAPRAGLIFDNVDIDHVRHGFYLSDCDDLLITGCDMKRYSKHGFRFEQGCDRVTLKACVADCSEGDADWETKTEVFPFGFNINNGGAPNTVFLLEDCVAKNNIKSNQKAKYTNGDGFVAEANTSGVAFLRCHALRNQDGGFDIKVKDAEFTDCVATGHRRDFRVWASATLKNCFAGWSTTGFWTKGGPIVVEGCTFIGHRKSSLEIEDNAPGPFTFTNCLLGSDEEKYTPMVGKDITLDASNVTAKPAASLGLGKADAKWDGTGTAGDSSAHPAKGYSSKRVSKAK